jgi:arsenate reductase
LEKKTILFICAHNSARSQMAEGFVRFLFEDRYDVHSGGTEATVINPYAIEVMKEIGIDLSDHYAKSANDFMEKKIDYVVTVCDQAQGSCPFFSGAKTYIHKGFQDPSQFKGSEEEILEQTRRVRDEIKSWIVETFGSDKKLEEGVQGEAGLEDKA